MSDLVTYFSLMISCTNAFIVFIIEINLRCLSNVNQALDQKLRRPDSS